MTLIRWSPQIDPFQEMEEMMKRLPTMMNYQSSLMHSAFIPAIDMYETDASVKVETSLPGINPKDVQITVEQGVLTLQGQTKKEHEVDEKNYYRREIRSGSFFRQVALPVSVDEQAVTAEFDDGVLKIDLPKVTPRASKQIEVKVVKKEKGK